MCQFLVYSKVIQLYVYIYSFSYSFPSQVITSSLFICLSCGMKDLFSWGMEMFSCSMQDLVPQPGMEPRPPHWKLRISITGPSGKSLQDIEYSHLCCPLEPCCLFYIQQFASAIPKLLIFPPLPSSLVTISLFSVRHVFLMHICFFHCKQCFIVDIFKKAQIENIMKSPGPLTQL